MVLSSVRFIIITALNVERKAERGNLQGHLAGLPRFFVYQGETQPFIIIPNLRDTAGRDTGGNINGVHD